MTRLSSGNKYRARRTWSHLCQRWFDSQAEACYGESLYAAQKVGAISDLEYQKVFVLSENPKCSIRIDFAYKQKGKQRYDDVKGVLTRDFRTKLIWLQEKYGIEVHLIR